MRPLYWRCICYTLIGLWGGYYNTPVAFALNEYGNLFFMLITAISISCGIIYVCGKYSIENRFIGFIGRHTLFFMAFDYTSNLIAGKIVGSNFFIAIFLMKLVVLAAGAKIWCFFVKHIKNKRIQKIMSI